MVLFKNFNTLANPNVLAGGSRRRRLFIPPSTNYPLFLYGDGDEQRSFLSMIEHGSVYAENSDGEASEVASIATSRSLPSTLDSLSGSEDQGSFQSWLLEEHQRRYSAMDSDEDESRLGSHRSRDSDSYLYDSRSRRSSKTVGSYLSELIAEDFSTLKTNNRKEAKVLTKFSIPLILTFVLEHLFSIISLLVVGHLGKQMLAAVSLGAMTCTITFAVFEGLATALDTLCPQAYGSKNYYLVSTYIQSSIVLSFVLFLPFIPIWWYADTFLNYVINDVEVIKLTTTYLRIILFGAPGYIFFENAKRFLQAQGIFEASTGVLLLSAPINIGLSWFLVWNKNYGLGYVGAPIATAINFWFMAILLVLYAIFVDGWSCWNGFDSAASILRQWKVILHLGVPGIVMLESEYLAYEIMTLFASFLGTSELAAQSALSSIASLTYMIPFSISIASATRVANFIGGENIAGAKIATKIAMLAGIIIAIGNCILLYTFRNYLARLFSDDPDVIEMVTDLFDPLVAAIQIFDGVASVAGGILRAQGRQAIGGAINFISYYAVAMPLSVVLSNHFGFGLYGLWFGIGCGMFIISITESAFILFSNWDIILKNSGNYIPIEY